MAAKKKRTTYQPDPVWDKLDGLPSWMNTHDAIGAGIALVCEAPTEVQVRALQRFTELCAGLPQQNPTFPRLAKEVVDAASATDPRVEALFRRFLQDLAQVLQPGASPGSTPEEGHGPEVAAPSTGSQASGKSGISKGKKPRKIEKPS